MTNEELNAINSTLATMDVKGKPYVEVNQRVKAFRKLFPMGCIRTTLLSDDGDKCTILAEILDENAKLLATGTAFEDKTSSYINKTSYIENCETSAVGRALGFLGIGIDTSIASGDEVDMAVKKQKINDALSKTKKPVVHVPQELTEEQWALQKQLIAELSEKQKGFVDSVLSNQKNVDKGWLTVDDITIEFLQRCKEKLG